MGTSTACKAWWQAGVRLALSTAEQGGPAGFRRDPSQCRRSGPDRQGGTCRGPAEPSRGLSLHAHRPGPPPPGRGGRVQLEPGRGAAPPFHPRPERRGRRMRRGKRDRWASVVRGSGQPMAPKRHKESFPRWGLGHRECHPTSPAGRVRTGAGEKSRDSRPPGGGGASSSSSARVSSGRRGDSAAVAASSGISGSFLFALNSGVFYE